MFGAYQAGAWKALEGAFQPDLVVGASIGAVNGWAIAGLCPAGEWLAQWLDFREASDPRWHWPWPPWRGAIDAARFEQFMQRHCARFRPRIPFALVMTRMAGLTPVTVRDSELTWRHMAASCAMPLVMPQYRIDGHWMSDGGLLNAVPVAAAVALGARRVVAVNILPKTGPLWLRACRMALRGVTRYRPPEPPPDLDLIWIEPAQPLGAFRETAVWRSGSAARWAALGERDARAALPRLAPWSE
jgi:predicted acylesterase/phospholipase RssA